MDRCIARVFERSLGMIRLEQVEWSLRMARGRREHHLACYVGYEEDYFALVPDSYLRYSNLSSDF